jgi:hypothetical protein
VLIDWLSPTSFSYLRLCDVTRTELYLLEPMAQCILNLNLLSSLQSLQVLLNSIISYTKWFEYSNHFRHVIGTGELHYAWWKGVEGWGWGVFVILYVIHVSFSIMEARFASRVTALCVITHCTHAGRFHRKDIWKGSCKV